MESFRLISLMYNLFSPVKVSCLGCYAESPYYNRIFPKVYLDYRIHIDWSTYPNMSHVVRACTRRALVRKYTYFAITNYGVCVWGPKGKNVARIAHSSPWCFRGLGGFWLVSVYKIDVSSSSKTFGKKKFKSRRTHGNTSPVMWPTIMCLWLLDIARVIWQCICVR